jgi:hypothetical protein
MSVGVMKDYKLKLRDPHASHTLQRVTNWLSNKARDSKACLYSIFDFMLGRSELCGSSEEA